MSTGSKLDTSKGEEKRDNDCENRTLVKEKVKGFFDFENEDLRTAYGWFWWSSRDEVAALIEEERNY